MSLREKIINFFNNFDQPVYNTTSEELLPQLPIGEKKEVGKQRYFLLRELGDLSENQRFNLEKLASVIDVFNEAVKNNSDLDLQVRPTCIRFDEKISWAMLCFNNFAEGNETDYFGKMIKATSWENNPGWYRFSSSRPYPPDIVVPGLESFNCIPIYVDNEVKELMGIEKIYSENID
ncbi:MAG: hypothetical protein PHX34_00155 [Candidatus Shapirobacteria bacterium]|nr:hypothetical protein [Candidatus Shapirobacteria bacterium]